jgi:hypothetical protein
MSGSDMVGGILVYYSVGVIIIQPESYLSCLYYRDKFEILVDNI